jgi:lipoate-protein ligase A
LNCVKLRLIFDDARPGAWNMAIDEALLASVSQGAAPAFRHYGWSEPTLSLGYFQSYAGRCEHPPSLHCPVVRRPSGGGAILHDREWTYSLILPIADRATSDRRRLYDAVHGALVESLRAAGISAVLWEADANAPESFLCFQRRSRGDVVLRGRKICGSAQRLGKAAVMQHGSILLAASPAAPELLGIEELAERRWSPQEIQADWLSRLATRLGLEWVEEGFTEEERRAAAVLAARRHAHSDWIKRR